MAARRYVMFGHETSYGSPALTTGAPTTATYGYLRLSEGEGAFKAEETPVSLPIMYGGGLSTRVERVSDQFEGRFSLETLLYPAVTQAGILLPWAITPINSGRTTPWTTTDAAGVMPVTDLASLWFGEYVEQSDSSSEFTIYTGAKVDSWSLAGSEMAEGRKWKLTASGMFKQRSSSTITHVPTPAEADYPTGPYVLSHIATGTGTFKIGTTRIGTSQIMNVNLTGRNTLDARFFETTRMSLCRFSGREVGLRAGLRLKLTPDDRAAMTAGTAQDVQCKLDSGSHTVTLDLGDFNKIHTYERRFPNGEFNYELDVQNYLDPVTGVDLTCTVT